MKTVGMVTVMLFTASSATAVVSATITPKELATAINGADAQLVPYRARTLAPGDIRAVRCIAPDEEPTEFQCKWQQRINGRWARRTTWLFIDATGWHVMDA